MDATEAESLFVRRLYEAWSASNGTELVGIDEWGSEAGVDWKLARRTYEKLSEKSLAEAVAMDGRVRLTAHGVLEAESMAQTPPDLVRRNQIVRNAILLSCLGEEEENRPRVKWEMLAEVVGAESGELARNGMLLHDLGFGDWPISGYYQLTPAGRDTALRLRAVTARIERFEQLRAGEGLTEQERGHEVEILLEEILVGENWNTERNVRAPGEEQDLVVNQGREYYLLESRWLAKRVEASSVREFSDRVTARPGVGGLFLSMSGFTSGAVEWARLRLESRLMLFFGPTDIERIISGQVAFSDLLQRKVHAAISRRQISFDE